MVTILQPGDYTVPPVPPPQVITQTIFAGLQLGQVTAAWGVGRSKPEANPGVHGTLVQSPGSPALYDFRPAVVTDEGGKKLSDNVYCYRDLTAQADPSLLIQAVKFNQRVWVQTDTPQSVQAFELDFPTPLVQGTMGLQFIPLQGSTWQVRAFDWQRQEWEPLPNTQFDSSLLRAGLLVGGDYTCDGVVTTHTGVLLGTTKIPAFYTQHCGKKRQAASLKAAFQLDATPDAKPYHISLNNLQVTFQ